MEILEGIFALTEMCGCFLEMAALASNGTAAYSGYKVYRSRKKGKPAVEEDKPVETEPQPELSPIRQKVGSKGEKPTDQSKLMWRFLIWLLIGVSILLLVIAKWAAAVA